MIVQFGPCRVELVQGDITQQEVDAIVNAANNMLQHGGGLAAAIVRAGGPEIQAESNQVAPVATGGAKATGAGRLPQRYVIHAVGPRWGEGDEDRKLASALRSALEVADQLGVRSVSVPAISTGIFGFPLERAASILLREAARYVDTHPETGLREIRFCLWGEQTARLFADTLRHLSLGSPIDKPGAE